jgi:hypothetical protein
VASEKQLAANRRNARRSTGPVSDGGKKRASLNSRRHGLTAKQPVNPKWAEQLEILVRKVAGDSTNLVDLENARAFSQAEFDLIQIRLAKIALIQKMAFPRSEEPRRFATLNQARQFVKAFKRGKLIGPMPLAEPERTAEARRRTLPELIRLNRYERGAAARRDRTFHVIIGP